MKPTEGFAAIAITVAGCYSASNKVTSPISAELGRQSPNALMAGEVMAVAYSGFREGHDFSSHQSVGRLPPKLFKSRQLRCDVSQYHRDIATLLENRNAESCRFAKSKAKVKVEPMQS